MPIHRSSSFRQRSPRPPRARASRWLLGVDGGATKTLAAVLDLETRSVHLGHAGPSNEDAVGAAAALQALTDAAETALEGAGVLRRRAGRRGRGGRRHRHGIDRRPRPWGARRGVDRRQRRRRGMGDRDRRRSGRRQRSPVPAPTSSGSAEAGNGWRTGGWGHLLGDEGSGYWLGAESIRAALKDRDGVRSRRRRSGRRRCAFFDCPTVEAVAALVYSKPLTKAEISAFAVECARTRRER